MSDLQHITRQPGHITLNSQPYELAVDPKTKEMAWNENPVVRGGTPKNAPGLTHIKLSEDSWLSEQVLESWHMGMGDIDHSEENTYHWGDNVDASEPGYVILGPLRVQTTIGAAAAADPVGYVEIGSRLYALWGRYIRELGTLNGTVTDTADKDFGAGSNVTDAKFFNNNILVALDNSEVFQSRASGAAPGTYTAAAAGLTADFFTVTESFLYRVDSDGSNTRVVSCPVASNPLTAASWSSEVDVGSGTGIAFTDLEAYGFQVMIGKQDGVYITNRLGFAPNILDELKIYVNAANGRGMQKYSGNMYIPHLRGLFRYDGNTIQPVGLEKLNSHSHNNLGPIAGVYRALTTDGTWLYVSVWNGTDTYILRYKEQNANNNLYGIWHAMAQWAGNQVTGMHVSGLTTSPSLWTSSTTNELISRFFLPASGNTAIQDTTYQYAASGTIYLGRYYMGSDTTSKVFTEIVTEGDNLAVSNETLTVSYKTAAAVPWVSTGFTSLSAVTTSPTTQSVNTSGQFLELSVAFARGSTNTNSPVLRRIIIRAIQRTEYVRFITAKVKVEAPSQDFGRGIFPANSRDTAQTTYTRLRNLEAGTSALTLIDPWGVSRSVYLAGPIEVNPIEIAPDLEPEYIATIRLVQQPS